MRDYYRGYAQSGCSVVFIEAITVLFSISVNICYERCATSAAYSRRHHVTSSTHGTAAAIPARPWASPSEQIVAACKRGPWQAVKSRRERRPAPAPHESTSACLLIKQAPISFTNGIVCFRVSRSAAVRRILAVKQHSRIATSHRSYPRMVLKRCEVRTHKFRCAYFKDAVPPKCSVFGNVHSGWCADNDLWRI